MKLKLVILGILVFTLSSCIDKILGERYVKIIKHSQRDFDECYQVKGLFNHFPKSIPNKSVVYSLFCFPTKIFDPNSSYFLDGCLLLGMGEDFKKFYPDTFIYKTNYSDSNFIVDGSFSYYQYYDTLKVLNIARPDAYPIPFFEHYNFGLDSVRFDLRNSGVLMVLDNYNVPEDLEVFVLKAGYGNFWKIEIAQERPETLELWKNGYSSGIAISKELNMVSYWMMAW